MTFDLKDWHKLMDTVLGWIGIAFLVLLEPVTMAYALWYARKRGWL